MDKVDQFFASVIANAAAALAELGALEVEAIRDALSVPIEYSSTAPPVRSAPGEPPRRGVHEHPLLDSVQSSVTTDTDRAVLAVSAGPCIDAHGNDYAQELELGLN